MFDFIRGGLADGVGYGHFINADIDQTVYHVNDGLRFDFAFKSAPEGGGHVAAHKQAGIAGLGDHRLETLDGPFDGGVDIFTVEGFASGREHRHLVHPCSQGLLQPFQVGHQGRVDHTRMAGNAGQYIGGIAQLGHPTRGDKGAHLDFSHAACGKGIDESDLGIRGNRCGFVL